MCHILAGKTVVVGLILGQISQVENNVPDDNSAGDYNILSTPRMSHLGDWWSTWTQPVHCPTGTFISAYKLDYGEQYGFLQHISLVCTTAYSQLKDMGGGQQVVKILNLGVTNRNYTENDLDGFQSSKQYATGTSFSTFKRESRRDKNGSHSSRNYIDSLFDLELLFYDDDERSSARVPSSPIKIDYPVTYWIDDQISYSMCTKGFKLCGVTAEVHRGLWFSHIEGIRSSLG